MKRKDVLKLIFCSVMVFNLTANVTIKVDESSVSVTNAQEQPTEKNYVGNVTFVTKNGNQEVSFKKATDEISMSDDNGHNANQADFGSGDATEYFMAWSDIENYDGTQKDAKLFYGNAKISNVFPEGLKGGEKLYAVYLTFNKMDALANNLGEVKINKEINTIYVSEDLKESEIKDDKDGKKELITYYLENGIKDSNSVDLKVNFSLNPYLTLAVRRSAYLNNSGNLDYGSPNSNFDAQREDDFILDPSKPNNLKERIADLDNKYTYIDLHVKLDNRINVADKIKFDFESYAFRPIVVLRGDYTGKLESDIESTENSPKSKITITTAGQKEFVIRARIKTSWEIPDATAEEALTDLKLTSSSKDNFSVSKDNILGVARKDRNVFEIKAHIQGGVSLKNGTFDLMKVQARDKLLDFDSVYVAFQLNAPGTDNEKVLGSSRVALNGSLKDDVFNSPEKPKYNGDIKKDITGETLPETPQVENYKFEGYNTEKDGSGNEFTEETVVNEKMLTDKAMTVYAQWSTAVSFDKNSTELKDNSDQDLGSVDVKYNKNLENGILRNGKIPTPTLEGYKFKEWNTKQDGKGEKLDNSKAVTEPVKYFAIWEKENSIDPIKPIVPIKPDVNVGNVNIGVLPNFNPIEEKEKTIVKNDTHNWVKSDKVWNLKNALNEKVKKAWVKDGKYWFRLNDEGVLLEEQIFELYGNKFHAQKGGYISENAWLRSGNTWYYAKDGGYLATNEWEKVNGKWYWFGKDSKMVESKWVLVNGNWYYAQENGDIVVDGWKMINGKWYHFNKNGEMSVSTYVGKYYVNENGEWVR